MKLILICALAAIATKSVQGGMTEAQVKAAGKLLRNVCQPKTKVSNGLIEGMHKGEFPDNHDLKSYTECTLRTGQIMKDAKINLDSLKTQMEALPPSIGEPGFITVEHCKDAIKSSDKYDAAYEFYKCFYTDNPANFFLP